MAGLGPAIHENLVGWSIVDARAKPGHGRIEKTSAPKQRSRPTVAAAILLYDRRSRNVFETHP
jgi:hypothetical protein